MILPGNNTHQKILSILLNIFKKDNNILVFGVFGSVAKGNWDKYSDLDLDVIVKDDSKETINSECKTILSVLDKNGFGVSLYFEEFAGEWVIIFDTLDRISIRFHLLENTIPHILDSFKILYGDLSVDDIHKSIVKEKSQITNLEILKDKFIELSIYVPIALHRNELINAEFFLSKMRNIVIEIYIKSRGIPRIFEFEKEIDPDLKNKIYLTYADLDISSIKLSLESLISLFIDSIKSISGEKLNLNNNERLILNKVIDY